MKNYYTMSLEEKVAFLDQKIQNYTPTTKWEKENNRSLKKLVSLYNKKVKALESILAQKSTQPES